MSVSSIQIGLDAETLGALRRGRFALCGCKAAPMDRPGWFSGADYAASTFVWWRHGEPARVSPDPVEACADAAADMPPERLFLTFAAQGVAPGVAVFLNRAQGLALDVAVGRQRRVSFDIDAGWSWDTAGWAAAVPAGEDLRPMLLIA